MRSQNAFFPSRYGLPGSTAGKGSFSGVKVEGDYRAPLCDYKAVGDGLWGEVFTPFGWLIQISRPALFRVGLVGVGGGAPWISEIDAMLWR